MGVNTILVTEYDEFEPIQGTEDIPGAVAATFRAYGIQPRTSEIATSGRLGLTDLKAAMKEWAPSDQGTVVYWLGHGCGPEPGRLVHSGSEKARDDDGILPGALVHDLCLIGHKTPLMIVILEACRTDDFARELKEKLRRRGHTCPTLILFSRDDVTVPRAVLTILNEVLQETFAHDTEVYLARVHAEVELKGAGMITSEHLNLGSASLRNSEKLSTGQTVEVHRQLLHLLNTLSADERKHFFSKAQSATTTDSTITGGPPTVGELTWNFEGRDRERQLVRHWMDDDRPMCVVQGAGGQGKSAFLGDIVTRCRPELAEALVRADLMSADLAWADIGQRQRVIAINASGLTTDRLLNRALEELNALVLAAAGPNVTEAHEGAGSNDANTGDGPDDVLTRLADTAEAVTGALDKRILFIIDGIDEMQDPHEGARIVASLPSRTRTKTLVATRDQPNDGQAFLQYANSDLTQIIRDTHPAGAVLEIPLHTEPDAIDRYVRRRLAHAFPNVSIPVDLGSSIGDFLHAKLVVEEVLADPEWLAADLLPDLAQADVTELYGLVLDRLEKHNPAFKLILQACALAQGRGVPVADDVWLTTARAISGQIAGRTAGHADQLTPRALADFIEHAQSHIRIDSEHDQTVFRPAHALLREHVLSTIDDVPGHHALLAELCAVQAASPSINHNITDRPDPNSDAGAGARAGNVYYRHAATMHARQSTAHQGWWAIDRLGPAAWRHLDRQRVVEDAMRDLFGRTTIPPEVEALILSQHHKHLGPAAVVDGWTQALRDGRRRPARGRITHPSVSHSARVRWARDLAPQPVYLSLPGHRGRITALHPTQLGPDESGLLVGTAKGDVWLWNLQTAGLVAEFEGLTGPVFALSSIVTETGLVVAAGDSTGRLIAWSSRTREQLWNKLQTSDMKHVSGKRSGPADPVIAAKLHRLYGGLICVIAVHNDHIQILDGSSGDLIIATPVSPTTEPHYAPQLATSTDHEARHTLAVPARYPNGYYPFTVTNRVGAWTLTQHSLVQLPTEIVAIRRHPTAPNAFRHLTSEGQITRSSPKAERKERPSGADRSDVGARPIVTGDLANPATALTHALVDPDTGLIQFHVTERGIQHDVHASHGERPSVLRIIETPTRPDRPLVASGGSDRTVRVWDPYSAPTDTTRTAALARHVYSLATARRETLAIAVDKNGRLQFINGTTARPIHSPTLAGSVTNIAASMDRPGRALIAAATRAGTIHLWRQDGLNEPENLTQLSNLGIGPTVDIDPLGTHIAVADLDCIVTLWEQGPKNTLLLGERLQEAGQPPRAVKMHKPFDDLTVILVVTNDLVQTIRLEGVGRRRAISWEARPHQIPDPTVYSLYTRKDDIGLVAGTIDGQTHAIPELWTPRDGMDTTGRRAIPALNLQQPVTAIHALQTLADPISITACGAYGRIKTAQTHAPSSIHTVELGQPITAAHTHRHGQLLTAILGGTALLDLHRT